MVSVHTLFRDTIPLTLSWQTGPRIATMKMAVLRIAKVRSLNLRAECQRPEPPAGVILGLRAGIGNLQYN
jgi:hypothetical protein